MAWVDIILSRRPPGRTFCLISIEPAAELRAGLGSFFPYPLEGMSETEQARREEPQPKSPEFEMKDGDGREEHPWPT